MPRLFTGLWGAGVIASVMLTLPMSAIFFFIFIYVYTASLNLPSSQLRNPQPLLVAGAPVGFRSRLLSIGRHPLRYRFPGPRVRRWPDVLLYLPPTTDAIFIVPEVEISTYSNRLHAIAATNHHPETTSWGHCVIVI